VATSTTDATAASGTTTYSSERIRSDQKFPRRWLLRRLSPRMTAAATAIPVAIEVKLATVIPAIWEKSDSVVSPL
jgi:hypothetical protein